MKNIELTEEQRSNLLKMCKALYPEYSNIYMTNEFGVLANFKHSNLNKFVCFSKDSKITAIHWFEFLVMYLTPIILKGYQDHNNYSCCDLPKDDYYTGNIRILFINGFHPIDYLYKEFLKQQK